MFAYNPGMENIRSGGVNMESKLHSANKRVGKKRTWHIRSGWRLSFFITLVLTLLLSTMSFFLFRGNAMDTSSHCLVWDVEEGDTLWTIASAYLPPGRDIRDYVDEIKERNQLRTPNIAAGQQLLIPVP